MEWECWSCHEAANGLVCGKCGAVQAPRAGADKFALLGLTRGYAVDGEALERRFRELSRRLHPDRFAKAGAKERMLSLQASTALNDAYRVLRDPVKRAEYLLELAGARIGENDPVDPEFLMEMLELREASPGKDHEALARDVRGRRDAALREVERLFASGGAPEAIKHQLTSMRYFQRFLNEMEGREEI
jgi:molecular chaperone HscB